MDSTQKSQVISTNNEGVTAIFPNFDFILNWENQRHAFIFAQNDLKFYVPILRTTMQKNDKIAIVIFCLHIVRNCNQSCANFQFLKFKVQDLDIATLLGAEGPQKGPKGPRGPKGPPALRRS